MTYNNDITDITRINIYIPNTWYCTFQGGRDLCGLVQPGRASWWRCGKIRCLQEAQKALAKLQGKMPLDEWVMTPQWRPEEILGEFGVIAKIGKGPLSFSGWRPGFLTLWWCPESVTPGGNVPPKTPPALLSVEKHCRIKRKFSRTKSLHFRQ